VQVQARPLYNVAERFNFESDAADELQRRSVRTPSPSGALDWEHREIAPSDGATVAKGVV